MVTVNKNDESIEARKDAVLIFNPRRQLIMALDDVLIGHYQNSAPNSSKKMERSSFSGLSC
jgi:hypothetical protein